VVRADVVPGCVHGWGAACRVGRSRRGLSGGEPQTSTWGPSLAFGAYQMLFYDPDIHDAPQGSIPFLMQQARVVGDIREPAVQDAVAKWWFTHFLELFDGNWLLVAAAWHMGASAVRTRILEPSGLAPADAVALRTAGIKYRGRRRRSPLRLYLPRIVFSTAPVPWTLLSAFWSGPPFVRWSDSWNGKVTPSYPVPTRSTVSLWDGGIKQRYARSRGSPAWIGKNATDLLGEIGVSVEGRPALGRQGLSAMPLPPMMQAWKHCTKLLGACDLQDAYDEAGVLGDCSNR
jgi:hypothetical protein